MANPSLQIGNSNWAIKKDNLLGYTELGNNIAPVEIDMTRASAGTRVNSSGLVETVELLGSEDVVNGDFATDSDWGLGTGWTISGGSANSSGSNEDAYLSQSNMVIGKTYKVTFDVNSYTSGALSVRVYGESQQLLVNSTGSYSVLLTPSVTTLLGFRSAGGSGGYVGSIDNVSVKESTRNDLARVDYTGSTSSLLAEPQRTNLFIQNDYSTWNGFGSYSSNTTLSPDGSTINFINFEDLRIYPTTTISSSTEYSTSIYIKANKTADVKLRSAAAGDTVISLTTEWQRFDLTATSSSTTSNALLIDGRFSQSMGASGLEIAIYGGQIEAGSYATSYIPTSGSTVTRVKDQYSKTGISDKIGQTEGSIYFEFKQNQLQSYTQRILTLYSDSANLIEIQLTSSNELVFVSVKTGESAVVITKSNAITLGSVTKISAGYKAGDFVFYVNGVQAGTDTDSSKTIPQMDNLLFSRYNSTAPFIGSINSLKLYKTRLTNTQLEELTT
jgi:hypothetical protein